MRNTLWLTGVGTFTAVLFGFLGYFNYLAYRSRGESYYLVGVLVFGGIAVLSIYAVVNGWLRGTPGSRRYDADDAAETEHLPDDVERESVGPVHHRDTEGTQRAPRG